MNTEFRNKILNRYVESAETENTQEREAFLVQEKKLMNYIHKLLNLQNL